MKRWRSFISALLAALMLIGCLGGFAETAEEAVPAGESPEENSALTLADIEALGAKAYIRDGRVTFVDGACVDRPIGNMEDAAEVIESALALLGGDERTKFEPWRTLTDPAGNIYYVFMQVYADLTVPGGAVKLVTDADGNMLGLTASVADGLPDEAEAEGISAEEAEAVVLERLAARNESAAELVAGRTEKTLLPFDMDPDIMSLDELDAAMSQFVWTVYTDNPGGSAKKGTAMPFLVHYVAMDGKYIGCQPTMLPGDDTAVSGYDAAYAFEFMEPAEYTGTVTLADGSQQEITVTLMRDSRTGMYYLGNLERRIAVADFYEFVYNDEHRVAMEASPDNTGWNEISLMSLYNYCRVWDYYNEIGWTGSDGKGTPMLILTNYCNADREPIDNAGYIGPFFGWETFISTSAQNFALALDVLAHEFTHCVTAKVTTYNDYKNDHGAFNEAMSDIQGNICEMMMGATADTAWALGENTVAGAIRSMSDPRKYEQPEHSWDIYYMPNVREATVVNDHGGVHTNSSLLNGVAWRLCEEGGMTLEEARAFWFAVDCSMAPDADYPQLVELLPWVLENMGMAQYRDALAAALDATRLGRNALPEAPDDDLAMVTLTLPDDPRFTDGNWVMYLFSIDTEGFAQRYADIMAGNGEYAGALEEILEAICGVEPGQLEKDARDYTTDEIVDALLDALAGFGNPGTVQLPAEDGGEASTDSADIAPEPAAGYDTAARLVALYNEYFADLFTWPIGAAGEDGRTVNMACRPGLTLPVLIRMEGDQENYTHSVAYAAYTFGEWHDLGSLVIPLLEPIIAAYLPEEDPQAPVEYGEQPQAGDAPLPEYGEQPQAGDAPLPENGELPQAGDAAQPEYGEGTQMGGAEAGLGNLQLILSSPEGRDALKRTFAELGGMLGRIIDPQALIDLVFLKTEAGKVCEIPTANLDAVAVFNTADYALLYSSFGMPPSKDLAFHRKVAVDYGTSQLYSREDLREAVKLIERKFKSFDGCEMHALRYAGDVCNSLGNIQWVNSLDEGKSYVQVVEFLSDFHTPAEDSGALEPDYEYTDYQWWLARAEDGEWKLVSWGY